MKQHQLRKTVVSKTKKANALFGSLKETCENFKVDGVRLLTSVATDLFESLDTPVSLSCEILLRYGEYKLLLEKVVHPLQYNDSFEFRDDYQAVSFLKKVPFEVPGIDRTLAAKKKFLEAEGLCLATNKRIRAFLENPLNAEDDVRKVLVLSCQKIQDVLGAFSDREWLFSCRFGPGTFAHPLVRGLSSVYDKVQVQPSVSNDLRGIGAMLVMSSPCWARSITDQEAEGFWPLVSESDLTTVPGNKVTFVPKTGLVDRPIAIEPLINIYAQLGIGKMIRKRLQKVGIDLNDQSRNQRLAAQGSLNGLLSTIDLSSASDTVSRNLVSFLLPEKWHDRMDLCRSKVGLFEDKWIYYEKFSSMGNGFTFELESLIFWALAASVCQALGINSSEVSVYGDDIIVPVQAYDLLETVLTFCGFVLNKAKSFKEGYFRESCGKDYYNGINVRPFFQKEVPTRLNQVLALANGIRRTSHRRNHVYGCDYKLCSSWHSTVRSIPASISKHLLVPAHAGDTDGLVVDWDYAQRSGFVRTQFGWDGFWGLRYAAVPKELKKPQNFLGGVTVLLYRCRDGFPRDFVPGSPTQERSISWKLQREAFYGPWTDLGPWV